MHLRVRALSYIRSLSLWYTLHLHPLSCETTLIQNGKFTTCRGIFAAALAPCARRCSAAEAALAAALAPCARRCSTAEAAWAACVHRQTHVTEVSVAVFPPSNSASARHVLHHTKAQCSRGAAGSVSHGLVAAMGA